jgi:hypothetical protein
MAALLFVFLMLLQFWLLPTHLTAIFQVLASSINLTRSCLPEIPFKVTSKSNNGTTSRSTCACSSFCCAALHALGMIWLHVGYYALSAAAVVLFALEAGRGHFTPWEIVVTVAALGWALLTCLYLWPPISAVLLGWLFPSHVSDQRFSLVHVEPQQAAAIQRCAWLSDDHNAALVLLVVMSARILV